MDTPTEAREKRKRGPLPGPVRRQYPVLLDEQIGDWAKAQPGGLSGTVRRLLEEAYLRENAAS